MITVAPTGRLITGDILDVNRRALEMRIKDYDSQAYLVWNPEKCKGWGCWELRRKPSEKTALHVGTLQGAHFYELDYLETNQVNHLKDWAFLNYSVLGWMKTFDQAGVKSFADKVEAEEAAAVAERRQKADAEMRYHSKQYKNQIRGFRELVLSGKNPAELARYWGSKL